MVGLLPMLVGSPPTTVGTWSGLGVAADSSLSSSNARSPNGTTVCISPGLRVSDSRTPGDDDRQTRDDHRLCRAIPPARVTTTGKGHAPASPWRIPGTASDQVKGTIAAAATRASRTRGATRTAWARTPARHARRLRRPLTARCDLTGRPPRTGPEKVSRPSPGPCLWMY